MKLKFSILGLTFYIYIRNYKTKDYAIECQDTS